MPEILIFGLDGNLYAIDIRYTREIVEALPVTPIPRAPPYIAGMTNIRGEITTLISLSMVVGQDTGSLSRDQKFIIIVPEAARGDKVGFIVDHVSSVCSVPEENIDMRKADPQAPGRSFIKGIIKLEEERATLGERKAEQKLVLYLDTEKILSHLFELARR